MNTKDAQVLTGCTWADADSVADILEEVFDIRPVLSFAFNWASDLSLGTIPQDIVTPSMAQSYLRCDWDTASRMAPRLQELFRMAESTHAIIIWYNEQIPIYKNYQNLDQPSFPIDGFEPTRAD
jgi:hypothetical protein